MAVDSPSKLEERVKNEGCGLEEAKLTRTRECGGPES